MCVNLIGLQILGYNGFINTYGVTQIVSISYVDDYRNFKRFSESYGGT